MKKSAAIISAAVLGATMSFAQTNVTFKPGAAVGEDATLWQLKNNCVLQGMTQTPAALNWGNEREMTFSAWTWSGPGCGPGVQRVLIRFKELSTLIHPNYITQIVSAKLRMFTPNPAEGWGNSYYPGSPLPNPNPGWIQRVLPGNNVASSPNNWQENTVTWNSQPAVDSASTVLYVIPATTARYGFTQEVDVTAIVGQIINGLYNDPYANNGFMLSLQDEIHYRGQDYASSDNPNASLWPELVISYNLILRKAPPTGAMAADGQTAPPQDDPTLALRSGSAPLAHLAPVAGTDLSIVPNPSTSGWNISVPSAAQAPVSITIYDVAGKEVSTSKKELNDGNNSIYISAEKLPVGLYFIEVKGPHINMRGKAIKS